MDKVSDCKIRRPDKLVGDVAKGLRGRVVAIEAREQEPPLHHLGQEEGKFFFPADPGLETLLAAGLSVQELKRFRQLVGIQERKPSGVQNHVSAAIPHERLAPERVYGGIRVAVAVCSRR